MEFAWLARIMLHCAYTKVIGIRSGGHLQNAKFFPRGSRGERKHKIRSSTIASAVTICQKIFATFETCHSMDSWGLHAVNNKRSLTKKHANSAIFHPVNAFPLFFWEESDFHIPWHSIIMWNQYSIAQDFVTFLCQNWSKVLIFQSKIVAVSSKSIQIERKSSVYN